MTERGNLSTFQNLSKSNLSIFENPFESRSEAASNSQSTFELNLLSLVSEGAGSKSVGLLQNRAERTSTRSDSSSRDEGVKHENRDSEISERQNAGRHHERHHRHKEIPSDAKKDLKKELPKQEDLRDGDIIFVSSSAFEEAKAIQTVSKSPMTHCGILFKEGDDWFVYEAVQPVKKTPLKDFHKPDSGETYAVRRLKDADTVLTKENLTKLHDAVKGQVGKDYDHLFGWGNDKMYCSELVWKAYYEATRQKVGQVKMVGDFDLTDPLVKKHVEARYGKNVPVTEPTITPGGIFDSRLLKTVR